MLSRGGAGFAPFILTLDSIFNALTMERGGSEAFFAEIPP